MASEGAADVFQDMDTCRRMSGKEGHELRCACVKFEMFIRHLCGTLELRGAVSSGVLPFGMVRL